MKSISSLPVLCFALLASVEIGQSALIFEEQFAVPPNTVGTTPAGWTTTGNGTNNDFIAASNLTHSGLAAGTAGSFGMDGSQNQGYRTNYSGSVLASNATIFYSFLFRLDAIGSLSTVGYSSGFAGLSNSALTAAGNGMVSSWGIRKDSADGTKFNLSVDGAFRGSSNNSTQIVGLGAWASTGGTQFDVGTTYLLVASYTNATSTSSFWVNPASSSFGGIAPTATATDSAVATANIQSIMLWSISNTSLSTAAWTVDAFRVGNTYADVTPVPEPATWGLLTLGLCALIFLRRRAL